MTITVTVTEPEAGNLRTEARLTCNTCTADTPCDERADAFNAFDTHGLLALRSTNHPITVTWHPNTRTFITEAGQ